MRKKTKMSYDVASLMQLTGAHDIGQKLRTKHITTGIRHNTQKHNQSFNK